MSRFRTKDELEIDRVEENEIPLEIEEVSDDSFSEEDPYDLSTKFGKGELPASSKIQSEEIIPISLDLSKKDVNDSTPINSSVEAKSTKTPSNTSSKTLESSKVNAAESKPQEVNDGMSKYTKWLEEYKAAQEQANETKRANRLGKAATELGASIAGLGGRTIIEPNKGILESYDENIKDADRPIQQIEQRQKQEQFLRSVKLQSEKDDANSPLSKSIAGMIKKIDPSAKVDGLSATQLEEGGYTKYVQLAMQKRLADLKAESNSIAKSKKNDDLKTKRLEQMNKAITEEVASSRSTLGVAARNKQRVQNIKTFMEGDLNDLTPQQAYEVVRALDSVLSGGVGTVTGAKELKPETAMGDLAKFKQYISGEPVGGKYGKILDRYKKTLDREEEMANKQIKIAKDKLIAPYKNLEGDESYQHIMRTHGLDTQSSSQQPQSNEIKRLDRATGKTAIFDANSKQFIRYE